MGPLEVVVLDVFPYFFLGFLEAGKGRVVEAFLQEVSPKALNLAAGLGVVGAATNVADAHLGEEFGEFTTAPPSVILPTVVRQNFLGHPVFLNGGPKHLQHVGASLEAVQAPTH